MTKAIKDRVVEKIDKRILFWEASDSPHGLSIKMELESLKEEIVAIIKDEFAKMKEKKEE